MHLLSPATSLAGDLKQSAPCSTQAYYLYTVLYYQDRIECYFFRQSPKIQTRASCAQQKFSLSKKQFLFLLPDRKKRKCFVGRVNSLAHTTFVFVFLKYFSRCIFSIFVYFIFHGNGNLKFGRFEEVYRAMSREAIIRS